MASNNYNQNSGCLRDGVWQFIGALVAIATLLFAFFTWIYPNKDAFFSWISSIKGDANIVNSSINPYPPHYGTLTINDPLNGSPSDSNWENVHSPNGETCEMTASGYMVSEPNVDLYKPCHMDKQYSNFILEAQMKITKGNCGGLSLRDSPNAGGAYSFQVCQDETYIFSRFDNFHGFQQLLSGSTTIHSGLGAINTIAVVANGPYFDFYINSNKVDRATDATYKQGTIGVCAKDDSQAVYTNVRVWVL
jgi:hypothetical protein